MSGTPYGIGPGQRIGQSAHLLRAAGRRGQHFLTGPYPARNRAGVVTVAQYENLLRFFIPPPGSEAGSTERNIRGPGCHRAPVPHLQRVSLRLRVRRAARSQRMAPGFFHASRARVDGGALADER